MYKHIHTGMPPPDTATVLRTQRPPSLGLSRRSSLCVTHLPSTRARQVLSPPDATPDSPASGGLPSEGEALDRQQDGAAAAGVDAVLSPLRQLDLNATVATPKAKAVDEHVPEDASLTALLRLCGQTVRSRWVLTSVHVCWRRRM